MTCDVDITARWRPAALGRGDIIALTWATIIMVMSRGWDYATGPDADGRMSAFVEAAAPRGAWAAAFLAAGVILTAGAMLRRHLLVWLAHGILATLYGALFVGILAGALAEPWFEGIRHATILMLPAMLHFLLMVRTGVTPIAAGKSTPVAALVEERD